MQALRPLSALHVSMKLHVGVHRVNIKMTIHYILHTYIMLKKMGGQRQARGGHLISYEGKLR
jgi:hypothetical protein